MRLPEEREGNAQLGRTCTGCLVQGALVLAVVVAALWRLM